MAELPEYRGEIGNFQNVVVSWQLDAFCCACYNQDPEKATCTHCHGAGYEVCDEGLLLLQFVQRHRKLLRTLLELTDGS